MIISEIFEWHDTCFVYRQCLYKPQPIVNFFRRGEKSFTIFNFAATPYSMENIVYLATTGLAGPVVGSKYQKRVIFKADFDRLRGIFLTRRLTKLRKCRNLRESAASLTLFVMRVYKSIKIGSLWEKILILSQFVKPSTNPHRAGNDQNRTFLIRIMILGGFRFELLDRAPGQFLSISTWLVNYTILTIGIGFAERCRIVKETRRSSFRIGFLPPVRRCRRVKNTEFCCDVACKL